MKSQNEYIFLHIITPLTRGVKMKFIDRYDAGERLANRLKNMNIEKPVVLGLPRGGVIVAAEVADALNSPLGVILVKKIGHPDNIEYAIGALAEGHEAIWNENEVAVLGEAWLENAVKNSKRAIDSRRNLYHSRGYTDPDIVGKTAILIDDGIATGLTFNAAVKAVYSMRPKKIIVAAPVAAQESLIDLDEFVDEFVILENPETFNGSVSAHYEWFPEIEEDEVCLILERHAGYGIA